MPISTLPELNSDVEANKIIVTGDATGEVAFNGSADATLVLTISPDALPEGSAPLVYDDRAALVAAITPAVYETVQVRTSSGSVDEWTRSATGSSITHLQGAESQWWKLAKDVYNSLDAITNTDKTSIEHMAEFARTEGKPFFNFSEYELFVDVNIENEKFADDTLVAKYLDSGSTQTADEYAFDSAVDAAYRIDADAGVTYALYEDDIQRFNAFNKALQWYDSCPKSQTGQIRLRFANGLIKMWGKRYQRGFGSLTSYKGFGIQTVTATDISFSTSPRGTTWSQATITVDEALNAAVVVGYAYGASDIMSANTTAVISRTTYDVRQHHAASASALVTDGAALCNGGGVITSIAGDRLSFTVDIPHVNGSTTALTSPANLAERLQTGASTYTTTGPTGGALNDIVIPLCQLAPTGGFDGRSDESMIRAQYGGDVEEENIAWVDHTDPTITRPNGFDPDRKMIFGADCSRYISRTGCVYIGGEGRVARFAKMVVADFNNAYFGAAGVNTLCERMFDGQIQCSIDLTRCGISGAEVNGIIAGGRSDITAQNCTVVGSTIGVNTVTRGEVNFQSSWVSDSITGVIAQEKCHIVFGGDTVIENCGTGVRIEDKGSIEGSPIYIGNTTDVDDQTIQTVLAAKRTANLEVTGVTFVADTVLIQPLEANSVYEVAGSFIHAGNTAADGRVRLTQLTDAEAFWNTDLDNEAGVYRELADDETFSSISPTLTAARMCHIRGTVTTGATAGDVGFEWRQNVNNATPLTILAGSYIRFTKIG